MSCADDFIVKIWNTSDYSLLKSIQCGKSEMKKVLFINQVVLAGGSDGMIRFIGL